MRLGWIRRAARAVGYVCAFAATSAAFGSEPARADIAARTPAADRSEPANDPWRGERHPVWLRSESGAEPPVLVYPPVDGTKPAPLVVLLHGMCGHPENECPWFAGAPTSSRYLVCPRADLSCPGTGAIWSGGAGQTGAPGRFAKDPALPSLRRSPRPERDVDWFFTRSLRRSGRGPRVPRRVA
jgi:hypothetical protein